MQVQEALANEAQNLDHLTQKLDELTSDLSEARPPGPLAVSTIIDAVDAAAREATRLSGRQIPVYRSDAKLAGLSDSTRLGFREAFVPYTASIDVLRERRLGAPVSLAIMAAVLVLIAWRLWVVYPLGDVPNGVDRGLQFASSRDSLVAVLLFFPAILSTQLERVESAKASAMTSDAPLPSSRGTRRR